MARAMVREMKWMILAGTLYMLLCVLLLFTNMPPSTIEPINKDKTSATFLKEMPLGQDGPEVDQRDMMSLIHSRMFVEQKIKLKWIGERIMRMSSSWEEARDLVAKENSSFPQDHKKILLFPGLLSEYSAYDFANNAYKGGYLGELVQWSDLISTLHMLGHSINILTSQKQLAERVPLEKSVYDYIFTDYIGLFALRDSQHFYLNKCKIRVLDSFGTEPIFNFRTRDFQVDEHLGMYNNWNFEEPRQFWTLFPHTPDNTFLGFVVEAPVISSLNETLKRENQGVVYGKEAWYSFGKEDYLNTIGEVIQLHATFKETGESFPAHITNHGVLSSKDLHKLLWQSKLFIGLGFPYDGPGPFEALANGCSFIQPRFNPPHSSNNTLFFKGKPTRRELTSQVPYLEQYVGEPYIYTVDISNHTAVKEAVYKALQRKDKRSFIPHEFSQKGMLERVRTLLSHQNFCDETDLALGRVATASSTYEDHTPGEAVDGLMTKETCYWSAPDDSHWWMVDLGEDFSLYKIRITNTFEWLLAKNWGAIFIDPFTVTLTDSRGNQVASKTFTDSRTFYLWEDINLRARFIRLDSLSYQSPRYFVLCGVEVFGSPSRRPVWPDLTYLWIERSKVGGSCKEACASKDMICEPAHFRALNSHKVLRKKFNCSSSKVADSHAQYSVIYPAWCLQDDAELGITAGTCVTNENTMLLSCAGRHEKFQRLCPCRKFTKGQIAVPPPL